MTIYKSLLSFIILACNIHLLSQESAQTNVHAGNDPVFGQRLADAEAEDGELHGTQVSSSIPGFSGSGYVTGFDADNDRVEIPIAVQTSGDYTLAIRYNSSSFKAQMVSVNGASEFSVDFPDQEGWALASAGDHPMEAGINTVSIRKSWGYMDVDRIELYAAPEREFDLAPSLIDPDADASAIELYEMLKMQFGYRIIAGQTNSYFEDLSRIAGKTPMLIAGDLTSYTEGYPYLWDNATHGHILGKNPDGTPEELIAWHQDTGGKGLISLQWHWHAPIEKTAGQNNFYTENTDFDIRQAVIPGTPEYDATIRDIDDIAAELQKFEDAGVPVLWRPLHEAGGGWFWWGAHGAEPCLALWDTIYNRLTHHHELHNLIWVWSTPEEDWYPGNERVDILGYDSYPGNYNYGTQRHAFHRLFDNSEGNKLLAMTENGPIPDPEACLSEGTHWLYFCSWSDLVSEQNSSEHIRDVFSETNVLSIENPNTRTSTEWRSSLYPEYWKPGYRDEKGRFLHDFSHAGYQGGGVPLPVVTENIIDVTQAPYHADNEGTADVTAVIQSAIDAAGAAGGGVVYLPSGTYRILCPSDADYALHLSRDNVVLRGAGPDSTFIFHDQPEMRRKTAIFVSPAYASWFSAGGNQSMIRHDLLLPTRAIPVQSVEGFSVGTKIIVRNSPTEEFIAEHGMTGMWNEGIKGVAFYRTIDSIDMENRLLLLDTPTRYALKTRDHARVYLAKPHLQEVGLEEFSIGNRENTKTGWGDNDYNTAGTGAYDAHFSHLMKFEYAENSWVKKVHTYKPEQNYEDIHLLSNCLLFNMCRHITVDSCDLEKPKYEGGGGNGYMYTLQSNDVLISNCRANHSRHNYDFKYPFSNGNVILNCRAENSRYSSDFHMYMSMSNLFDRTRVNGDYLESAFRPYGSTTIHGHSSSQSVFYNTHGEAYHDNRDYLVDSRQYGWGYIIGTSGEATRVKTTPYQGTQGGYAYDSSPEDFVEGEGLGEDLRPLSLYLDQLDRRNSEIYHLQHYSVEIKVYNAQSGEVVEGSQVDIYGQSLKTDADGSASFTSVPESFYLELADPRYHPIASQHHVIYSDTLLSLQLEENSLTLDFEVLDAADLSPFRNLKVILDDQYKYTSSEGKASFTVHTGSYQYTIEKPNYHAASASVEVVGDLELQILLERSHADLKIRLSEEGLPVNNAWISVGGDSVQSSSLGLGSFSSLPIPADYHYSVRKEGYEPKAGSLSLEANLTVDVEMVKASTIGLKDLQEHQISLWPVPAQALLRISFPEDLVIAKLRVLDVNGRILIEKADPGARTDLDISLLERGVYLLQLSGPGTQLSDTFIKL